jgi:uncharacterized protein YndB with AHSA1/START domain
MSSLRISRTLAAPIDRVWAAFTDPEAVTAWFWPESMATKVTADVRPGGRFRIDATAGGFAVSGVYREVVEPSRLVMTWQWDGEEIESLVTIELIAHGEQTELDVRHDRLADDASRDQHALGWSDCLDRLPGWLAG